ncbi:peripherin-2-like isoform X1 [Pogonomyrmex barbatus]|uniref:Peripherin-2-like isoform X1 n=1 Tax=Pogonomyrmex barbatus TaxID=144034 RepID=A0A6I9VY85_9HYME|nr:peripherin-2-like isoform X1 [Pogonomyrmex barbatus]
MTKNCRNQIYRKRASCICGWEVKFGYGVAFTLAVFETKRLLVFVLEVFAEWQVIRFAGGFQPVVLTFADVSLGLPCALITVRTIRRHESWTFLKTKQILRYLLIMIVLCTIMNATTLASIGCHISVRQKTLINVFNASMHLYATASSYKYVIDEIQFILQCCGHSSYTDWFLFDWQSVDYASQEEMAEQNRISDEDYRSLGVPFSCCNLHAEAPCMHLEMTDDKTINVNGCAEVISPILLRIVIVAYVMTITLIIIQVLLAFLITRMIYRVVPLQMTFPQVRCSTKPFTIVNTSRTYVSRFSSLKKSTRYKKSNMQCHSLMMRNTFIKKKRIIKSPKIKRKYPSLNYGNW